jgi:uncharacterized protein YkwD
MDGPESDPGATMMDEASEDEVSLFDMINGSRAAAGMPILSWDPATARVARAHCIDMRDRQFVGHTNPEGEHLSDRLDRAGIERQAQGECIVQDISVDAAHQALMSEPLVDGNHHFIIVWPHFTHMGIGVVAGGQGSLLITEDFIMRSERIRE